MFLFHFVFWSHTIILITWRIYFPDWPHTTLLRRLSLWKRKESTCILEPQLFNSLCNPKHEETGKASHFSLWFKARRRVKPCLSALCSCLYTSCKNMAKSTDFPHGCVLEVASKNDFKTCRNCQALRICLLKTHKIVTIEKKTASQLFLCALKKSV